MTATYGNAIDNAHPERQETTQRDPPAHPHETDEHGLNRPRDEEEGEP